MQKLTCPEYAWSPRTLGTPCPSPLFSAPPCGVPLLAACSHRQRTVVLHETSFCPGNMYAQVLFNKCNSWQKGIKREKLPGNVHAQVLFNKCNSWQKGIRREKLPGNVHAQVLFHKCNSWQKGIKREKLPGNVHAQVLFHKCNSWQNGKRERKITIFICCTVLPSKFRFKKNFLWAI